MLHFRDISSSALGSVSGSSDTESRFGMIPIERDRSLAALAVMDYLYDTFSIFLGWFIQ
jgi:hypothetical protein